MVVPADRGTCMIAETLDPKYKKALPILSFTLW